MSRIASIAPSAVLGVLVALPAKTSRAACSASNGVALAGKAAVRLAGRTVHLDDLVRVTAQEAGQARPIGPGSFDAERDYSPVASSPPEQRRVPVRSGRDEELAEAAAKPVEDDGDMLILVRVDTDDDIGTNERDAGHGC